MRKRNIIIGIIIALLFAVVYIVVTLNSGEELNEASPLNQEQTTSTSEPVVKDNLDTMDEATMQEFMTQVEAMQDVIVQESETMPTGAQLLARGDFMRRIHGVKGQALLIKDDDKTIVRFEDFETDNGPGLYIYLSSDLGDDDFIDLGPIRATRGNINYTIPAGVDTDHYRYVLVWCRPFGVLFSYAELIES